jgi:hypothetical protein
MKEPKRRAGRRKAAARDRIETEFGPGAPPPSGPLPGYACGGERCVFAPATALVARFAAQLGPRHLRSLSHAAVSGIELMKALRDFLDEEIAIAERAAAKKSGGPSRYERISVE